MERESKGWIKLARKIIDSWLWEDAAWFKRWIALLLAVNFDSQTVEVTGEKICVCAGETLMTIRRLAKLWDCSKSSANNYLDDFQTERLFKKVPIMVGKQVVYKIVVSNYNGAKIQKPIITCKGFRVKCGL